MDLQVQGQVPKARLEGTSAYGPEKEEARREVSPVSWWQLVGSRKRKAVAMCWGLRGSRGWVDSDRNGGREQPHSYCTRRQ